jgi:hypothetical protein
LVTPSRECQFDGRTEADVLVRAGEVRSHGERHGMHARVARLDAVD